jgi:hypothetical protein
MAAAARHWSLDRGADRAPEGQLNASIWKSVKGRNSRMPAPRHRIVGVLPQNG